MLNNITNFLNLISLKRLKKIPEDRDVFPMGTLDRKYRGRYKPTFIEWKDLKATIGHPVKAGLMPKGNFSGSPLRATVTFDEPFNAKHSPMAISYFKDSYSISVDNISSTGFDIVLNSVHPPSEDIPWTAVEIGEY